MEIQTTSVYTTFMYEINNRKFSLKYLFGRRESKTIASSAFCLTFNDHCCRALFIIIMLNFLVNESRPGW